MAKTPPHPLEFLSAIPLKDGSQVAIYREKRGVRVCHEDKATKLELCSSLQGASGKQTLALFSILDSMGEIGMADWSEQPSTGLGKEGVVVSNPTRPIKAQADVYARAKDCYGLADNGEAMACLNELIKEAQTAEKAGAVCAPKWVLLKKEGCQPCAEELVAQQPLIQAGLMDVVDVTTPRGLDLVRKNKVEYTPQVFLVDCGGKLIE